MNLYSMKWNDEISKAQHGKLKEKEKNKSLAISFTGQEKKYLMNACLGSFSQKLDNQKRCDLKPNASFQSIDVSNMGLNQWQVVITSGNENKNKDVTVSKLIVTRNELSAKKELQYEIFRNNIKMKLDKDEKDAKCEIEGGHIMPGDCYEFVILKTNKGTRRQYLSRINLGDITTKIK